VRTFHLMPPINFVSSFKLKHLLLGCKIFGGCFVKYIAGYNK